MTRLSFDPSDFGAHLPPVTRAEFFEHIAVDPVCWDRGNAAFGRGAKC